MVRIAGERALLRNKTTNSFQIEMRKALICLVSQIEPRRGIVTQKKKTTRSADSDFNIAAAVLFTDPRRRCGLIDC